MKKRIIILYYPIATNLFQSIPYAMLYLERMLQDMDVEVVIFDEKHDQGINEYIVQNKENIMLIGISVMLSNQLKNARLLAEFIKSNTDIPVLFGGWFTTYAPEIVLREDFVDFIILGQGEIPLRSFVLKLLNNDTTFHDIKSLGYKKNGGVFINEREAWINQFELPPLDFEKIKIENYLEHNNTMLQYIATSGCNCKCNFCMLSSEKGSKHAANRPLDVINDIENLKNKVPTLNFIKFNDDNFFSNKEFVLSFCKLVIENNLQISWNASAHIKQFLNQYNDEDLKLIRKAGCVLVYFGAESGDNDVLRNINKNYTRDDIKRVLIKLKENNIRVSFSIMVAFPPKPEIDLDITLKFIMKLYRIYGTLDISLSFYLPALENKYHFEALKLGFTIPKSYKYFEYCVKKGFNLSWINNKIKKEVFYFGYFYIPVYKSEVPVNTDNRLRKIWKIIFIMFYPIVWLRFISGVYKFNFDAILALKIISFFSRKHKVENEDLNNFMMGINRLEEHGNN